MRADPLRFSAPRIRVHDNPDLFSCLGASWRDLANNLVGFGPFLGPDWCELWWDSFGEGNQLHVLEFGEQDALVPLYRTPEGLVSFLGGQDVTDYVGVVGPSSLHPAIGSAVVDHLADSSSPGEGKDWERFTAVAVPAESGFTAAVALAAIRRECDVRLTNEQSVMMRLPSSWDAYLASVGKKERHEIRRKERRLARELGPLRLEEGGIDPGVALDTAVERFIEMHRLSKGEKGEFMMGSMADFFRIVVRHFAAEGSLRLDTLFAGDEAVAATVGFADNFGYYLYNSGFAVDLGRLSPGNVLLGMLIRREIAYGRRVFDFLRGDERYKFRLGGVSRPLKRLEIRSPVK